MHGDSAVRRLDSDHGVTRNRSATRSNDIFILLFFGSLLLLSEPAQKESGFNQAFSSNKYIEYATENVYLNDSQAFIEKPQGKPKYLATLKYNGNEYAVKEFTELGIVYCDDRADKTYPTKLSVTTADHNVNYVMLKRNEFFLSNLRYFFERGCFRFKDLTCKEVILKALSY